MASLISTCCGYSSPGAYRKPREVNWLIGVCVHAGVLEDCSATRCPTTSCPGPASILEGVLQGIPIVGTYLAFFLPVRGRSPVMNRAKAVHPARAADPWHLLGLITAHCSSMFHQKHTQMPPREPTEKRRRAAVSSRTSWPRAGRGSSSSPSARGVLRPSPRSPGMAVRAVHAAGDLDGRHSPTSIWACWKARCASCPRGGDQRLRHTLTLSVLIPALLPLGLVLRRRRFWPFFEQ